MCVCVAIVCVCVAIVCVCVAIVCVYVATQFHNILGMKFNGTSLSLAVELVNVHACDLVDVIY